ncbi:MAG: MOSC domain-containing protein [Planctomycetia bacterium]|nr:MOSC domain-containing protein [Planctomycetia bacterium]
MREITVAQAEADGGIAGDLPVKAARGITFISAEQWQQVADELAVPLAWHTRRANVLVEGLRLGDLFGKTIRLGTIEVRIVAETRPCGLMDRLHPGLQAVLKPDCQAGIHGRVLRDGTFAVGDRIEVVAAPTQAG